jgi:serine-type D-Ala-D-Ala carboxypeptidase (penicillin-binding protein 5/6)
MEHRAEEMMPPASLTKMMTSYVVEWEAEYGKINYTDMVRISETAWRKGGSKMFVRVNTEVSVEDLLRGIIIQSGNDASIAMAEYIAGSEDAFADVMNQHGLRMGLKGTQFKNATGWPADGHYSTARDLAIIAKALINDFPEQYKIYAEKYFTYNEIRQPNRNLLLWRDNTVDGLKTGHTEEAGYCLVASAVRDGMRLISVVMGARNEEARARETQKLFGYGFRYFETHKLYEGGETLQSSRLWKGAVDEVQLGLAEPMAATITRGQRDKMEAVVEIDPFIRAPIAVGQVLGSLKITVDNELVGERPLVALQAVEEGGIFKRLWHSILLFFKQLIS